MDNPLQISKLYKRLCMILAKVGEILNTIVNIGLEIRVRVDVTAMDNPSARSSFIDMVLLDTIEIIIPVIKILAINPRA